MQSVSESVSSTLVQGISIMVVQWSPKPFVGVRITHSLPAERRIKIKKEIKMRKNLKGENE